MLITFSGLDGAGKTTLIRGLKAALAEQNRPVTSLTMYDHVGLYAWIRFVRDWTKRVVGRANGQGVESGKFHNDPRKGLMRDAESRWPTAAFYAVTRSRVLRRLVLFFDLLVLLLYLFYLGKVKNRIVILDRYFYDSLADVADGRRWLYIRLFVSIAPTPDVPILVDVSAEEAFARKGEYSVDYLKERRATYQKIFGWVHRPVVVANDNLDAAVRTLETAVAQRTA